MTKELLTKHDYQGSIISQRDKDGYVSLTQMCVAEGKLVADYLRLDSTNEYLSALSLNMGIPILREDKGLGLVEVKKGGNQAGTWAHPEVALDCAQWVSVGLRIWANRTLVQVIKQQPAGVPLPPVALPKALPLPEQTLRSKIVEAVDNYCFLFGIKHSQVWTAIYRKLKHIYHYDASARLKTSGSKRSKIEQVEFDGRLEEMRSVAQKVLHTEI